MGKAIGVVRKKDLQTLGGEKISIEQMKEICASCAQLMKERGLVEIDAIEAVSDWNSVTKAAGVGGDYPGKMPSQLVKGLCKKFGGDPGFFTRCEGSNLRLPAGWDKKAYCAELHKHCIGKWPTEGEHPKRTHKQLKLKIVNKK